MSFNNFLSSFLQLISSMLNFPTIFYSNLPLSGAFKAFTEPIHRLQ